MYMGRSALVWYKFGAGFATALCSMYTDYNRQPEINHACDLHVYRVPLVSAFAALTSMGISPGGNPRVPKTSTTSPIGKTVSFTGQVIQIATVSSSAVPGSSMLAFGSSALGGSCCLTSPSNTFSFW